MTWGSCYDMFVHAYLQKSSLSSGTAVVEGIHASILASDVMWLTEIFAILAHIHS